MVPINAAGLLRGGEWPTNVPLTSLPELMKKKPAARGFMALHSEDAFPDQYDILTQDPGHVRALNGATFLRNHDDELHLEGG